MKISTRGEYGLRALTELAMRYGEGPIQSAEIASRQEIPENYLNQLLISLRRGGLIRSLRGPQGGHLLSKPPTQITVAEAVAVLEGPTAPMPCVEDEENPDCQRITLCALRNLWLELKAATDSVLGSMTLDQLCHGQDEREESKHK